SITVDGSHARRRAALIAAAAVAIIIAAGIAVWALRSRGPSDVRIATGTRGGTFLPLGRTLARGLAHDLQGTRFEALESPGGVAPGRVSHLAMDDAASALEARTIDAAFMVAGMRTPAVDRLLARGDMRLLSLGEPDGAGSALEGIQLDAPFFRATAIPARSYG